MTHEQLVNVCMLVAFFAGAALVQGTHWFCDSLQEGNRIEARARARRREIREAVR